MIQDKLSISECINKISNNINYITVIVTHGIKTRNSSADERANVNFLYDYIVHAHALGNKKREGQNKQLSSRYIARNKVHFACGKHTCLLLPNLQTRA